MKNVFNQRTLLAAAPVALLLLGTTGPTSAQPANPVMRTGRRGRRASSGISAQLLQDIQAKTGRPVTADQKAQLDAAAATHRAAVRAADTQFRADIARITGLSQADARSLGRKPKGARTGAGTAGVAGR